MDKEEKLRKDLMKQNLIETELAHPGPIDPVYRSDAFNYYQRIITPQGIPEYLRAKFFGPLNEVLNYGFLDEKVNNFQFTEEMLLLSKHFQPILTN